MKIISTCILLLLTTCAMAQVEKTDKIEVDGISRSFVTYVPVITDKDYKPPLVVSLHGGLGNGERMMRYANFKPMADKDKFIIVCPNGIGKSWNDGRQTKANKRGVDDVKFIGQLITYIIETYHADESRVYITGMSNGGFMASRLACELSNRIAAIAAVGASMDSDVDYKPMYTMPVMYIQGAADPLVPFNGGEVKIGAKGPVYAHADVLKIWVKIDSCNTKPSVTNYPDNAGDGTTVTREEYSNPNGLKVIGYTIHNGGHVWPGSSKNLPRFIAGSPTNNLNACQAIWDFFKHYRHIYTEIK